MMIVIDSPVIGRPFREGKQIRKPKSLGQREEAHPPSPFIVNLPWPLPRFTAGQPQT